MDRAQAPASHLQPRMTPAPADSVTRRWGAITAVGFSLVVALVAGDAPGGAFFPALILALLLAFLWERRMRDRGARDARDAVPWVLAMVALGAVAALLSPLAWPWAAAFGLFACAVQLPLIRRIG